MIRRIKAPYPAPAETTPPHSLCPAPCSREVDPPPRALLTDVQTAFGRPAPVAAHFELLRTLCRNSKIADHGGPEHLPLERLGGKLQAAGRTARHALNHSDSRLTKHG
jgi:hypothetical protein